MRDPATAFDLSADRHRRRLRLRSARRSLIGAALVLLALLGPMSSADQPERSLERHARGAAARQTDASTNVSQHDWIRTVTAFRPAALPKPAPCAELPCWSWPLPAPRTVQTPYRAPPHPYGSGHRGIDLSAAVGSEVLAVDDGTVSFAGHVVDRPVITIAHHGSWRSSHEPVEPAVALGDSVVRGQVIGHVASGPHCASCLHLGARHGDDYYSPLLLIEGGIPSRLLPLP